MARSISKLGLLFVASGLAAQTSRAPLADAAASRSAAVEKLLAQGADVNAVQGDGMTALHWAVFHEDVALTSKLLSRGARWDLATRNGALTPLFLAATSGNAKTIELLLAAGAPADSRNATGATPLMFAAAAGSEPAIAALLARGADVNAKDTSRGQTALFYAAGLNRAGAVKLLLSKGADPGVTTLVRKLERLRVDMDGNATPVRDTPPTPGAKPEAPKPGVPEPASDQKPAAPQVAESKAAVRKPEAANVESPQVASAKPGPATPAQAGSAKAPDVANFSPRESGATVVGGQTALLIAARDGNTETVRALLAGGAKINQVNEADKNSPLLVAIINGHLDLASELLDRGADPKLVNDAGLGPLFAVIDVRWVPKAWYPQPDVTTQNTNYLDLLEKLIARGAPVNARLEKRLWFRGLSQDPTWVDSKGATPFWRAAQAADTAAMKLLLKHGADPALPNSTNVTPLMVASGIGWMANHSTVAPDSWLDAAKLCLDAIGAKRKEHVQLADARGYTALHGAGYIGHNELVLFLVGEGAKVDAKTKAGDSPADMANGPTRFGMPHPQTLALLEKLGSPNSHNCRSDQCLVAPKPDAPKPDRAKPAAPAAKPDAPKTTDSQRSQ